MANKRSSDRGFVLAAALIIAVLYFALMELLLLDSSRALQEAQQYRSRVIAATLAESGAELAAMQLVTNSSANVNAQDSQGTMTGTMTHTGNEFDITGDGDATGVPPAHAHVTLKGAVFGNRVQIDFATHVP